MSLTFLDGSTLDFIDDLSGSFFQVNNPNASSVVAAELLFLFNEICKLEH